MSRSISPLAGIGTPPLYKLIDRFTWCYNGVANIDVLIFLMDLMDLFIHKLKLLSGE